MQASQDIKRSLAACFVITDEKYYVIGYYTLSNDSLSRDEIPKEHQKKVPQNYNVPVTLLGRLARDISAKGTGIGEHLLLDALNRCYNISVKGIGSMAVIVDPINENAIKFYSKYGFTLLPDSGKMFLPMKTISQLFK
jgi:ribosomal protein S18 acetylase RimI-like enzyme